MAVLNIRNLPDEVHAQLRLRAAKARRSMEAEARAILTAVCMDDTPPFSVGELQEWVNHLYANHRPPHVVDDFLAERRQEAGREYG
jgi:hypothetical protein